MSAITLENVSLAFAAKPQPFTVLEDISLSLHKGEFVVLLGPSGCGKSTILNLVAGFNKPDRGAWWRGKPVRQPGPDRGMIFQQPNLFPWLSVLENVTLVLGWVSIAKMKLTPVRWNGLDSLAYKALSTIRPGSFQAMKQRVALARAWLPGPDVLLLDEPSARSMRKPV